MCNTHDGASLYQAYDPAAARRILDRIDFHYTPKHGSWLNMALKFRTKFWGIKTLKKERKVAY